MATSTSNFDFPASNLNSVSSDEAETDDDGSDLVLELESMRPRFSVAFPDSFVESILDLKEWLKSPWSEDVNDNIPS